MDLKKLGKMAGNLAKNVDLDNLDLEEVITDQFINKNTKLDSVKSFIEKSGFDISKITDFTNLPAEKLDSYVKSISSFGSWKEMLIKAVMK
ncbi:MAG: hypothetical protein R6U08_00685 [Bacillota bacterium]